MAMSEASETSGVEWLRDYTPNPEKIGIAGFEKHSSRSNPRNPHIKI